MQVYNQIENLVFKLEELKKDLTNEDDNNQIRFDAILESTLENDYSNLSKEYKPDWVNSNYFFETERPRKPNMRELMEAISGKSLEQLYAEPDENWKNISQQASDLLYGVVGANEDTRDWPSIMASGNILSEARKQTGAMHEPEVDIESIFDTDDRLTEQIAVIKDGKGNTLRSLTNNISFTEETLLNFGATKESIPTNFENKVDPEVFDRNLLNFLKNFGNHSVSIEQIVVHSASEVIANKLSQEIPPDELSKL